MRCNSPIQFIIEKTQMIESAKMPKRPIHMKSSKAIHWLSAALVLFVVAALAQAQQTPPDKKDKSKVPPSKSSPGGPGGQPSGGPGTRPGTPGTYPGAPSRPGSYGTTDKS